jgi:transcription elongation GreA/GreB family factor
MADTTTETGGGELMELARERQFDALEAAWMKRLDAGAIELPELFSVAEYLVRKKFPDQASLLLWSLVAAAGEKLEPARALDVAIRAATIAPAAEGLREEIGNLFAKARPGVPELRLFLDASGLRKGIEVPKAVALIEACLKMRPGSYVIHVRSRRVGRIESFADGLFQISSEGMRPALAPADVVQSWEPLPAEDFRALVAFELPKLRQMAKEEPVGLIERLLASVNGRAEFKQIKFMLIPAVIPADGWSAWWNSVKVAVKRSPVIEMGAGTQPVLELRKQAATFADKFRTAFLAAPGPYDKVKQVMIYLGEIDAGHESDPALTVEIIQEMLRFGRAVADLNHALAYLAAACELRARHPGEPDPTIDLRARAAELKDAAALVRAVDGEDVIRMVLDNLRKLDAARGPALLADAFPAGSLRLCEWTARELDRAGRGDLLRQAAARVAAAPDQFPESFGWVWRWTLSAESGADRVARVDATLNLLELMNRLARVPKHSERREELRQALGKLRNLLSAGDYRALRDVTALTATAEAHRMHLAVSSGGDGLTGEACQEILAVLREKHPEEFVEKKSLWEDGFIYTSAEGLARKQAELEKLMLVDIPRNAEAIGKAASLGDLRENWEYKSALEERDRLVERTTRTRDEVSRAKVLQADMISGQEVNVGAAVTLRRGADGVTRQVRFVGAWDADIARGIYSYLAPISLRFMGRKPGDRVRASFDDTEAEYEIVAIEKTV